MGVKIKDTLTPEGKKFYKMLEELADKEVRIGYQHGEHQNEDGVDLCDIAAFNELGTKDIPSRPFLRDSVDNNEAKINSFLQKRTKELANGMSAEKILKEIGVFQKGLVQEEIVNGSFVPNAEATIRRKGSSKPLIDTGRMRQSVNYVIKRKGSGN